MFCYRVNPSWATILRHYHVSHFRQGHFATCKAWAKRSSSWSLWRHHQPVTFVRRSRWPNYRSVTIRSRPRRRWTTSLRLRPSDAGRVGSDFVGESNQRYYGKKVHIKTSYNVNYKPKILQTKVFNTKKQLYLFAPVTCLYELTA